MIVALLRMSKNKIVSSVVRFFITVLRGTPLMLQLLAVTYGPHYLFRADVSRNKLIPVVIAFSINYAAYFAGTAGRDPSKTIRPIHLKRRKRT